MVLDYDGCFPEAVGRVDGVDVERGKRGEEKASLSDGMGSMTLTNFLQSWTELLSNQAVMHPKRMLSMVYL